MWHEDYSVFVDGILLPTARGRDYLVPGLVAEAGEVADKFAKAARDEWPEERLREEVAPELGDLLFFIQAHCNDLNITLADLAAMNVAKLESRRKRNKLQGSGDKR